MKALFSPIRMHHRTVASGIANRISGQRRVIRGVIFDMDGTLTVPVLDFAEMRRRAGVLSGDILDVINTWPEHRQTKAYQAIAELEEQALVDMQLLPGVIEVCQLLDTRNLPRAIVTRNVERSVEYFHDQHFPLAAFRPAMTREFKPYKPSPAAALEICKQWGISPTEAIMIGDSAKDDVVSGNRAGCTTVLLDSCGKYAGDALTKLSGDEVPHFTVNSMAEFQHLLNTNFDLQPPRTNE